ncbi:hypothetical protein N7532_010669 [Penicillium argentinense]|uniref:Major facilitator superfamily (MFS) profile domain-containing protein n=1 Tax=Penicillium argentinense TaxID=1131581 RepID=A0A9W9EQ05_9EURO|nr:uncharacterized protein N7532_010669 [Penicillium argentinense]KAJ5085898.1 hypothetical protein N7532_010669 [Penicillium argentinense]
MSSGSQEQQGNTSESKNENHTSSDTASIEKNDSFECPEGGLTAWLVVVGAFMMLACSFGMMNTLGIFQSYWAKHQLQSYSSSAIGWISSVFVFLSMMLGVQSGPIFDRYGPRWPTLIGSILYTLSIFLMGNCKTYYQFMLCFGVLGGISSSLLSTPAIASISHWFKRRLGIATGIALAGSSVGGIIFSIILRHAMDSLGWAWALRVLGFIFLAFLSLGNLCVRGRLPTKSRKGSIDLHCFKDIRFIWVTTGVFFAELVLIVCQGLLPSYASAQGFDTTTGTYMLVMYNVTRGSAVGRLVSGIASDHVGPMNTMSLTVALTMLITLVLWLPVGNYLGVLYPVCLLLGAGTGSYISLTAVCVGRLCKVEEMGQWLGTCYFIGSFGTLVGIPIGGELLQIAGPSKLVAVLGGIFAACLISFLVARWSCLKYEWKWLIKV